MLASCGFGIFPKTPYDKISDKQPAPLHVIGKEVPCKAHTCAVPVVSLEHDGSGGSIKHCFCAGFGGAKREIQSIAVSIVP